MKTLIIFIFAIVLLPSCGVSLNKDNNIMSGKILIDLKENVKADAFSSKLSKYELKEKKIVSPSLNIVLFDFNESKITVEKLIKKVKAMDEVENAQTNKKIEDRRR